MTTSDPAPAARSVRQRFWSAVRWLFAILLLAYLLSKSQTSWSQVRDRITPLLIGVAVVAIGLNIVGNVLLADNWARLLAVLGQRVPRAGIRQVWSRSQLARYAVGSAQLVSRPVLAQRLGVPLRLGIRSTLVETVWQTAITATATAVLAPTWSAGIPYRTVVIAGAVAGTVAVAIAVVFPQVVIRPLLARIEDVDVRDGPVLARQARALSGWYGLNTLIRTCAFLLLFAVLADDPGGAGFLAASAAFLAGNLVGRVVIFAPGGLGPREAVTAVLLASVFASANDTVTLLAAARLVELVAELLTVALLSRGRERLAVPDRA